MAKRRKKTKSKAKRRTFKFGGSRKKKQRKRLELPSPVVVLKVLVVIGVIAALGIGFVFLEKYVNQTVGVSEKGAILKLVDVPEWVNDALKDKVYLAAIGDEEEIKLDETAAKLVQQNIESGVSWFAEVKVQTMHKHLLISGKWRKPLALVKFGLQKFYVDSELVAIDFVPMPNLPIVNVIGLSVMAGTPEAGQILNLDDLAAAVGILERFDKMDRLVTPDKPLLYDIDNIDLSNFDGRENKKFPHIIIYTKDDTEIIWGARIGAWQRHLEATDEEKLAKLYGYYEENGSLLGGAKYINLRDPQDKVSLPIDKY